MTDQTTDSDTFTLATNSFTREYYSFAGWNTAANGSGNAYTDGQYINNLTADLKLYAQWDKNDVVVTYDANGGSGEMDSVTLTDGNGSAAASSFTRAGYTFTKWNTAADGSGTTYAASASLSFDEDTTLYAQWTKKDITISYNRNAINDSGDMDSQDVKADTDVP